MKRNHPYSLKIRRAAPAAACALVLFFLAAGASRGANEAGLWSLWRLHSENPGSHDEVIAACESFIESNPADPFVAVAETLAAWHLLKTGSVEDARARFAQFLGAAADSVESGALEQARAWLTRMDIFDVRRALQAYYRVEVRYPESLGKIAAHPRIAASLHPPMTDRWGREWMYRPMDFRFAPGIPGQRYHLESRQLGDTSSLDAALAVPYAGRISLEPDRVLRGADGRTMVQFRSTAEGETEERILIEVGSISEGVVLAHAGPRLIVVSDRLHWLVMPNPER